MNTLIIAIEGEGRLDTGIKEMLGNPDLHSFYMKFRPVDGGAVWPRYLVRKKLVTDTLPLAVTCDLVIKDDLVLPMTLFPKTAGVVPYKLHPKESTLSPQLHAVDTDDDMS